MTMFKLACLPALLAVFSCATSIGQPKMERAVTVWSGAPEETSICHMTPSLISKISGYPPFVWSSVLTNGNPARICLPANSPEFKKFGALTFDDIGVLQRYIETLVNSCQQWK